MLEGSEENGNKLTGLNLLWINLTNIVKTILFLFKNRISYSGKYIHISYRDSFFLLIISLK